MNNHWLGNRDSEVHQIEQNPPIRQEGNNIYIEYVDIKNISVSYEISVPADTVVRSRTGSEIRPLKARTAMSTSRPVRAI